MQKKNEVKRVVRNKNNRITKGPIEEIKITVAKKMLLDLVVMTDEYQKRKLKNN